MSVYMHQKAESQDIWRKYWQNWMKKRWCRERLRAGGEGANKEWDGWMVSPTQWKWVWANSWRYRRRGDPVMMQCMGSQRAGHDLATETTIVDGDINTPLLIMDKEFSQKIRK